MHNTSKFHFLLIAHTEETLYQSEDNEFSSICTTNLPTNSVFIAQRCPRHFIALDSHNFSIIFTSEHTTTAIFPGKYSETTEKSIETECAYRESSDNNIENVFPQASALDV
jgi:hypothetical protein